MTAPRTTAAFIDTLGVNVHVEYTDGKYANAANVVADLAYLGETHVRDAVLNPSNQGQGDYDVLAQAGIKFDMFFQGTDLSSSLSLINAFVARHPGAVSLIEGPNEVNNFPISYAGQTGNAAATAYQAALTSAVKADASLKGVPVADLTSWPFLSGPSDDANYHFYPFGGAQPQTAYGPTAFTDLAALEPGKPMVMTEGGYNTLLTDSYYGGVDETTQAKLLLNLYCDDAVAGVSTTYIYQLLDAYADPTNSNSDDHFGLFHLDNTPKIAATAIHDLTSILSDGATPATAATDLAFSLLNLPSSGGSLALTKNATTHDILIWSEPQIWDGTAHAPIAAPATNVTVHLAQAADVVVYDPLVSTQAIASYHDVQDVVAAVTDHPLIVEVIDLPGSSAPAPGSAPPGGAAAAPVNHAPVLGGSAASVTSDQSLSSPFAGMTVSDPDAGQAETVTVSFDPSTGSLSGGGFTPVSAGVVGVTAASAAAAQADLRALGFTPTSQPAGSPATTTTFNVSVSDGQATATDGATTVTASHTTNTPVALSGLAAGQAMTDKAVATPFSSAVITDPDLGQVETVTVTLADATMGTLAGGGFTAMAGKTGGFTVQAASALEAQADLRALTFTPVQNLVAAGLTSTASFTVQVSDGATSVRDASTTEIVKSVDDPAVFTGVQSSAAALASGSTILEAGLTLSDPDAKAAISAAQVTITSPVTGDALSVSGLPVGISAAFDAHAGVLTLSGAASDAAYAQALSGVGFVHDPAAAASTRSITFSVVDDAAATTSFVETVSIPATVTATPVAVSSASASGAGSDPATVTATPVSAATPIVTTPAPVTTTASVSATTGAATSSSTSPTTTTSELTDVMVQAGNLLRTAAIDTTSGSPLAVAMQSAKTIGVQLDAGLISSTSAEQALMHLVDGTTSVAELSYAFFTGRTPSAAGLNYLVNSDTNATDLNDSYYTAFSTQNRYINVAVSLAKAGDGTAAFHAAYDGLSLSDAAEKAYTAIFGVAASSDKINAILNTQVPDGVGATEARAQYFAAYGGDGVNGAGTKAAMIGWLLADSVSEGIGPYQAANAHFLADLAHGTAQYGVDLLSTYAAAPSLVGQSAPDMTLTH